MYFKMKGTIVFVGAMILHITKRCSEFQIFLHLQHIQARN